MIHRNIALLNFTNYQNLQDCVPMTTVLGGSFFAAINSGACLIAGTHYITTSETTSKIIQLALFSGVGFLGGAIAGGATFYYISKFVISRCKNPSSDKIEAATLV